MFVCPSSHNNVSHIESEIGGIPPLSVVENDIVTTKFMENEVHDAIE
jgi:hypothetical protein